MTDITLSGVGGEYMESAVLVEWRVADRASVRAGEVVAVVETAKAATDIEAPSDGILRILVAAGEEIAIGTVLARIGDDAARPAVAAPVTQPVAISGMPRRWPAAFASPLAKRLAAERAIDLHGVRGSGPAGRIVRDDVAGLAANRQARVTDAVFTVAVHIDPASLLAARAESWDDGRNASLGSLVAAAATDVSRGQRLPWTVTLLWDAAPPAPHSLAIIDLTPFGITEFAPPRLSCVAVLGVTAAAGMETMRLALIADAQDLSCLAAARFLATLREALEAHKPDPPSFIPEPIS